MLCIRQGWSVQLTQHWLSTPYPLDSSPAVTNKQRTKQRRREEGGREQLLSAVTCLSAGTIWVLGDFAEQTLPFSSLHKRNWNVEEVTPPIPICLPHILGTLLRHSMIFMEFSFSSFYYMNILYLKFFKGCLILRNHLIGIMGKCL